MARPSLLQALQPIAVRLVAACSVAICGCRAVDNAQVDVLERDLRQQEQYIYELEDYLMEYSEKLRQCRTCPVPIDVDATPARSTTRRAGPTLADDSPEPLPPRRSNNARPAPPAAESTPRAAVESAPATMPEVEPEAVPETAPESTPINPEDLEPPGLEIGPTSKVKWNGAAPIAATPPGDEAPPFIPDPANFETEANEELLVDASQAHVAAKEEPAHDASDAVEADAIDADSLAAYPPVEEAVESLEEESPTETVIAEPTLPPPADPARLVAERLQIRCILNPATADAQGPPASLLVVVEALNATNEPVDANGVASLMVTQGETKESLKPIDRWDFTGEETQAAWQSSQLGDGLHLELPLDDVELPKEPIYLWVRLVTPDGKNLRTHIPFVVDEIPSLEATLAALADPAAAAEGDPELQPTPESTKVAASDAQPETQPELQAAPEPTTQWRASSQPIGAARVEGVASSVNGPSSRGWTRLSPGRSIPSMPVPQVAATSAANGPPRWQQGSAEAPAGESRSSWAPLR